jgi:hypothetical protein
MLSEQNDQSYRGQVSQMVAPVQETAKPAPMPSWRIGVDSGMVTEMARQIREMLAGEIQVTVPLDDPRVVALKPQLLTAKVRIHLGVREQIAVSFNMFARTIQFSNFAP